MGTRGPALWAGPRGLDVRGQRAHKLCLVSLLPPQRQWVMSQCPASHYCICCQPGRKVPRGGPGSSLGPWKRPGACATRSPQNTPQRTRGNLPEVLGSVGLSPRVPGVIGVGFWFCLGEGFPIQAGRLPSLWRLYPLGMRAQWVCPRLDSTNDPQKQGRRDGRR